MQQIKDARKVFPFPSISIIINKASFCRIKKSGNEQHISPGKENNGCRVKRSILMLSKGFASALSPQIRRAKKAAQK